MLNYTLKGSNQLILNCAFPRFYFLCPETILQDLLHVYMSSGQRQALLGCAYRDIPDDRGSISLPSKGQPYCHWKDAGFLSSEASAQTLPSVCKHSTRATQWRHFLRERGQSQIRWGLCCLLHWGMKSFISDQESHVCQHPWDWGRLIC